MVGDVAFLYTSRNFREHSELILLWAYYVGTYDYETIRGFEKTIPAFRLSEKECLYKEDGSPCNKGYKRGEGSFGAIQD